MKDGEVLEDQNGRDLSVLEREKTEKMKIEPNGVGFWGFKDIATRHGLTLQDTVTGFVHVFGKFTARSKTFQDTVTMLDRVIQNVLFSPQNTSIDPTNIKRDQWFKKIA